MLITGIGSRKTPEEICQFMFKIGNLIAKKNWKLRSGHAKGSDISFENGYISFPNHSLNNIEIYLPWTGFNKELNNNIKYIDAQLLPNYENAKEIMYKIHPTPEKLTKLVSHLHTRNIYQVLGKNLKEPSDMIICWTVEGREKGGTRTAIVLGRRYLIPVYNLYFDKDKYEVENIFK